MTRKKITLIVCYCLIGVIALGLIICALVPKNYLPTTKNPDKLTITYVDDTKIQEFYNVNSSSFNKEDYDKIVSSFRNAFQQSVLSALFAGELISPMNALPIGKANIVKPENSIEVKFEYNEYQNIYINGKVYYDQTNSKTPVQTKTMYVYITDDIGFNNAYIYYEDDSQSSTEIEYYRVQTISSTSSLYKLCAELMNLNISE